MEPVLALLFCKPLFPGYFKLVDVRWGGDSHVLSQSDFNIYNQETVATHMRGVRTSPPQV